MSRKAALLLTTMMAALVAASGVALALDVTCDPGSTRENPCQGTTGDDLITGTTEDDFIQALGGVDTVNALVGDDQAFGGNGKDTLEGGRGDDALYGEAGADTLNEGSNPSDPGAVAFMCGGGGNDKLNGSTGADHYIFETGWGKDTISGEETDPAPSSHTTRTESLNFGSGPCGTAVSAALTINLATGVAFESAAGSTGANTVSFTAPQIENTAGGHGGDRITGNSSPNHIFGDKGNDTINVGGGGIDSVNCGTGTDTVIVNFKGAPDQTTNCETVDDSPPTPTTP
jgi:Ca2+-binding RTX toxin-like protein